MKYLTALALVLGLAVVANADCGVFFRQKVVHHAYVAPIVQPFVLYQAGVNVEQDALAERIAARVEAKLAQRLQAQQTQRVTASALTATCAKCHQAGNKSGYVFDGSPLPPEHITAALRAIASGDMPKGKPIDAATKGAVMEDLLNLEGDSRPVAPQVQAPDPGKLE